MTTLAPLGPRPSFWRSTRGRRFLYQSVAAAALLLLLAWFVSRALTLDLSLDFMRQRTGFAISNQWLTDFSSSDARWVAYAAGVFNTVRLVFVGIVLATLLGVVMGVARLSSNWLVARIATVYVETVRNTPLLVQIVFWYSVVLLELPRISRGVALLDVVYISNRGLALPWPTERGEGTLLLPWLVAALAAAVFAWWLRRRRLREEADTGRSTHANAFALGSFLVLAAGAYLATGLPVGIEAPDLVVTGNTQAYAGGLTVTPEFAALLFALVVYTASFITEIVRGSIQALPLGQGEAAAALGLSSYQRMTLVILPQALRTMIPAVTNQYLNLTKNSSLAVAIGYSEFFSLSQTIVNNAGHAVPLFTVIIATYMVLNLVISAVMNWFNRRVQLAQI